MTTSSAIEPGATLGVFGGGQLARMFAVAAARMGYRVAVYAPEANACAADVAPVHVQSSYDDDDAVIRFCRECSAVTLEFENVPVHCLELAAAHTRVRPGANVLAAAQDRLEERRVLDRAGLPTARHAAVRASDQLEAAVASVGTPGVLKSARLGYDGRGQARVATPGDAASAWSQVNAPEALYEAWVEYSCEVSVLVARTPSGAVETFGPIENRHANHILDVSSVPARVDAAVAEAACALARELAAALELEGLLCVEMFVTPDGSLLVNELAPRPHNSGHLTIEACDVSQFEQQVRVVCDLPLRPMTLRRPAAMKNLLGDRWQGRDPDWAPLFAAPEAHLHLYGKGEARPGRKMGHVTVLDDSADAAAARVEDLVARTDTATGSASAGDVARATH